MAEAILTRLAVDAPVFDAERGAFTRDGVRLSGLLPTLKRLFYPTFVHTRRKKPKWLRSAVSRPRVTVERGIRIHDALGEWCTTGTLPRDSLARQIAVALTTRGIRLVACEVPIAYTQARVATAIDAIGEDAHGNSVILEFKAGYQRSVRDRGTLSHVHPRVPSTPLNHATLQLAMTRAILAAEYHVDASQCLLVISNGTGVTLRSLPKWAREVRAETLLHR